MPVVILVDGRPVVVCSIECARHNGFEPYRMCIGAEYDAECGICGFDPLDSIPCQDLMREEL